MEGSSDPTCQAGREEPFEGAGGGQEVPGAGPGGARPGAAAPRTRRSKASVHFPVHYEALAGRATDGLLWGAAYRDRLRHEANWAAPAAEPHAYELYTGVVFGCTYLDGGPLPEGSALTAGISDVETRRSALTAWIPAPSDEGSDLGPDLLPFAVRLPASAASLAGLFDVRQRPGTGQAVCAGFSGDVAVLGLDFKPAKPELDDYRAEHLWTLAGHSGSVPAARCMGGGLVATASFGGAVGLWRLPPDPASSGCGRPEVLTPAAMLRDDSYPAGEDGAHSRAVDVVALSADGCRLASGGNDMQIKQWDLEAGKVTLRLTGHAGWVWCLEALGPAHSVLLSGSTDSTLRTWDLRCGRQVAHAALSSPSLPRVVHPVAGVALRCDARYAACGCFDGDVHVVDLRAMRVVGALTGHGDRVTRVACRGDGVLSGGYDGAVAQWRF